MKRPIVVRGTRVPGPDDLDVDYDALVDVDVVEAFKEHVTDVVWYRDFLHRCVQFGMRVVIIAAMTETHQHLVPEKGLPWLFTQNGGAYVGDVHAA